jgi:hypothetical protein
MRRRDFNKMALGIGLGSAVANPVVAASDPVAPTVITKTGRTYNQLQVSRKYVPGRRRFSVYWAGTIPGKPTAT